MDSGHGVSLVADIGKTNTRLGFIREGLDIAQSAVRPSPGILNGPGVPEALVAHIQEFAEQAAALEMRDVTVSVAGAQRFPEQSAILRGRLQCAFPHAGIRVASDITAAHAGAFGGRSGTVLIAGTGSVALGIDSQKAVTVVDGLGPELGDRGSGFWIGRRGIRDALTPQTGDANHVTPLRTAVQRRFGPDLAGLLAPDTGGGNRYAQLASFAPDVVELATKGEPQARQILDEAVTHLAWTARVGAEAADSKIVVGTGGLLEPAGWMFATLARVLESAGLALAPSALGPLEAVARLREVGDWYDDCLPWRAA